MSRCQAREDKATQTNSQRLFGMASKFEKNNRQRTSSLRVTARLKTDTLNVTCQSDTVHVQGSKTGKHQTHRQVVGGKSNRLDHWKAAVGCDKKCQNLQVRVPGRNKAPASEDKCSRKEFQIIGKRARANADAKGGRAEQCQRRENKTQTPGKNCKFRSHSGKENVASQDSQNHAGWSVGRLPLAGLARAFARVWKHRWRDQDCRITYAYIAATNRDRFTSSRSEGCYLCCPRRRRTQDGQRQPHRLKWSLGEARTTYQS